MYQPEVKMEFVRRYCHPSDGWMVFVDIDASEEGRTGGERKSDEARTRQGDMKQAGIRMRQRFTKFGVTVGGNRSAWFRQNAFPEVMGDRDIVAYHRKLRICLIAEVEGASSGQPEQKLYKAIGQLVMAASPKSPAGWRRKLVLVVHGKEIADHLQRVTALATLHISALALTKNRKDDRWIFGGLEKS